MSLYLVYVFRCAVEIDTKRHSANCTIFSYCMGRTKGEEMGGANVIDPKHLFNPKLKILIAD